MTGIELGSIFKRKLIFRTEFIFTQSSTYMILLSKMPQKGKGEDFLKNVKKIKTSGAQPGYPSGGVWVGIQNICN